MKIIFDSMKISQRGNMLTLKWKNIQDNIVPKLFMVKIIEDAKYILIILD